KRGADNVAGAVVVAIADACTARATGAVKPRLLRNIQEGTVAIIFVESIGCAFRRTLEPRAAKDEKIHPSVVIVVDKSATAAGGLKYVFIAFGATVDDGRAESGLRGNIDEMCMKRASRW